MPEFEVNIDLDNDGDYDDAYENISERVLSTANVSCTRGKNSISQFGQPAAGDFNALVLNIDRLLSPGNPSSPIYNQRVTGRRMQWLATGSGGGLALLEEGDELLLEDDSGSLLLEDSAKRLIFTGRLLRFIHDVDPSQRTVQMPSVSMLARLIGKNVSTGVHQNITTSDAIEVILNQAGWPADERIISTGQTTLAWWWWSGDAMQAIVALLLSEGPGASVYDNPDGYFVFEDRDYRTTHSRCTLPQAVYSDTDVRVQSPFLYEDSDQDSIEACAVTVDELAAQPLSEIWSHDEEIVLGPNAVWKKRFTTTEPFINAQVPTGVASNTIWKFEGDHTLTSGTFKGEYLGQITATLNYNATAAEFETAFEDLSTIHAGNIEFSGGPLNVAPIYGELKGDFAGSNITTLPTIVESTLNPVNVPGGIIAEPVLDGTPLIGERQRVRPSGVLTSGTWDYFITFSTGTALASGLAYNISASALQAAIIAANGALSSTTCDGGPMDQAYINVVLPNLTENIELAEVTLHDIMMDSPSATVNVSVSQIGGIADYVITDGALVSVQLGPLSGTGATIIYTADSAGVTLAPNSRVRAQSITTVRSYEEFYPDDVEERIADGEDIKVYRPDVLPGVSGPTALVIAMLYVLFYLNPPPKLTITIENPIYSTAKDAELQREVSDRVTAANNHLGISEDYFVERLGHALVGLKLITTLYCEKAIAA